MGKKNGERGMWLTGGARMAVREREVGWAGRLGLSEKKRKEGGDGGLGWGLREERIFFNTNFI